MVSTFTRLFYSEIESEIDQDCKNMYSFDKVQSWSMSNLKKSCSISSISVYIIDS